MPHLMRLFEPLQAQLPELETLEISFLSLTEST